MNEQRKRRPIDLLRLSGLFKGLDTRDLEKLSAYCKIGDYRAGTAIVSEKAISGHVYLIDSGEIAVFRTEDGRSEVVARFLGGECFGELDLFSDSGSTVTLHAQTDSRLLVFPSDGQTAAQIFNANPDVGSQAVKNLLSMVAARIRSTNNLISQRSPWVEELRKLVFVDKLTGLYNRTWLNEELEKEIAGKRAGTSFIIIKPDNFKLINDTYGHDAGDKTLSLLAETVLQGTGAGGKVARHGGDVFAVVCENANQRRVLSLTQNILKAIREVDLEGEIGAKNVTLTASAGIMRRKPGERIPVCRSIEIAFDRMLTTRSTGGNTLCDTGNRDE